jgi:hypothetical protein
MITIFAFSVIFSVNNLDISSGPMPEGSPKRTAKFIRKEQLN